MKATVSSFWLPKAGSSASEYEDAFSLCGVGNVRASEMRFSVADGASESYLAGRWADVIVRKFIEIGGHDRRSLVTSAIIDWQQIIVDYVNDREEKGNPIQWYEEPGIARGAFATLIGLELRGSFLRGEGKLDAIVIGDSGFFQLRKGEVITAWPLTKSEDFGTLPDLFPSKPAGIDIVMDHIYKYEGSWKPGDVLYIGTDAMCQWFLKEMENGEKPWQELKFLDPERPETFGSFINDLREKREIHNDDTTLVTVELH